MTRKAWTNAEYHADREYASHSALELLKRSIPLYKRWHDNEYDRPETSELRIGSALHTYSFEPTLYECEFPVCDAASRNSKDYKAFAAEHPGKTCLLTLEHSAVTAMAATLDNEPSFQALKADCVSSEKAYTWTDPKTGIKCKCKPDLLTNHFVVDLKTAANPCEAVWTANAARFGYHRQAAFYLKGMTELGLINYSLESGRTPPFIHVVVGTEYPWEDVYVRNWGAEDIELGAVQVDALLATLKDRRERDDWGPDHRGKVRKVSLPRWAHWEEV